MFSQQCLGQSWYLGCEMQLFWCSPFLLLPMWHLRHRLGGGLKWGLCACAVVLAGAWVTIATLSARREWTSNLFLDDA